MRIQAPAKINLNLSVSCDRDDAGYHAVETVMCAFELCDDVEVVPIAGSEPRLYCDPDPLAGSALDAGGRMRANIAFRAAVAMGEAFDRPPAFQIQIRKRIPSEAGLGGGSSDAAAVIGCIASQWGIDPVDPACLAVASSLGADVAFFLFDSPMHLTGRGDVPVERLAGFVSPAVLVKPPVGVSTGLAYREFDRIAPRAVPVAPLVEAMRRGDAESALRNLSNNMTPASLAVCPQLEGVFDYLRAVEGGRCEPLLCGSGSCIALFTESDEAAAMAAEGATGRGWWSCATRTRAAAV